MFTYNTEERIKNLEMEVMYLQRDMTNLLSIINEIKPIEHHTHYVKVIENITCNACQQ